MVLFTKECFPMMMMMMMMMINIFCGQNVELLNVKTGGTYSDHWAVKG
jgi:hypothetical protein